MPPSTELCKNVQSKLRACQRFQGDNPGFARDEITFEIDNVQHKLDNSMKRATWDQMCRRIGKPENFRGTDMKALLEELSAWLKEPWRANSETSPKALAPPTPVKSRAISSGGAAASTLPRSAQPDLAEMPAWAKALFEHQLNFNKHVTEALQGRQHQPALRDASTDERQALANAAAEAAAKRVRADMKNNFVDDHKDDWEDEVKEEMKEKMEDEVKEEMKNALEDDVKNEMQDELAEEIEEEIKEIVEHAFKDDGDDDEDLVFEWQDDETWQENLKAAMTKLRATRPKKRRRTTR